MDLGYKARLDLLGNVVTSSLLQDNDLTKLKNKDAVNNFLKTASKLTSIEENSELSSGGSSSEPTVRPLGSQRSVSSMSTGSTQSPSMGASTSKRMSRASSELPSLGKRENFLNTK